jgi:hypothetical protein
MEEILRPLPEKVIGPGESADIVLDFETTCWPVGLVLPDDVAEHLLVAGIYTDKLAQLRGGGAVPATLFRESAPRRDLMIDLISPGQSLRVGIVNAGPADVLFRGELRCRLAPPSRLGLRVLGYGRTRVAGLSAANVNVQPQVDLEPTFLHVPPRLLEWFDVEEVFSYVPQEEDSRAERVRPRAPVEQLTRNHLEHDGSLRLSLVPVVRKSQFLTVSVRNRSAVAHDFSAAILGVERSGKIAARERPWPFSWGPFGRRSSAPNNQRG